MGRKEIRQAITILTQRDPQYNFTILEKKDNKIKVEVLWTKDEKEILVIPKRKFSQKISSSVQEL